MSILWLVPLGIAAAGASSLVLAAYRLERNIELLRRATRPASAPQQRS
jgi:hypothetical protein